MTEFEQQVFDALRQALDEAPSEAGELVVLAPRVAAAAAAAAEAASHAEHDGLYGANYRAAWSSAFLAVLRQVREHG